MNILNKETAFGLWKDSTYKNFRNQVLLIKENTIKFFMKTRKKLKLTDKFCVGSTKKSIFFPKFIFIIWGFINIY